MKYYVIDVRTYIGQCADATHYYGKLCKGHEGIPVKEVGQWSMTTFERIEELKYEMTLAQAKKLDNNSYDRTRTYQKLWEHGEKMTEKFNTYEDVINAGTKRCQELGHTGKVAVMYEGELELIIDMKKDVSHG